MSTALPGPVTITPLLTGGSKSHRLGFAEPEPSVELDTISESGPWARGWMSHVLSGTRPTHRVEVRNDFC